MRVQLADLLAERPIIHPSRVTSARWDHDGITIELEGYRWWRAPYAGAPTEGRIRFVFTGLGGGAILPGEFVSADDEALEDFSLVPVTDVPWAQAADRSVYCSAPIPDPLALYIGVNDFLAGQGAFLGAADFLNQANEISAFVRMASSSAFLVAQGPDCIRSLVCAELEAQSVPHTVLETRAATEARYLVAFGSSRFLCEEAVADLDG